MNIIYEVGDGWIKICDDMMTELRPYIINGDVTVLQVKEKYGELNVYTGFYDTKKTSEERIEEIISVIKKYVEICQNTCEYCGSNHNVGVQVKYGWVSVLCENCRKKGKENN